MGTNLGFRTAQRLTFGRFLNFIPDGINLGFDLAGLSWDQRLERTAAMAIASIVRGSSTSDTFSNCPHTAPTNISVDILERPTAGRADLSHQLGIWLLSLAADGGAHQFTQLGRRRDAFFINRRLELVPDFRRGVH